MGYICGEILEKRMHKGHRSRKKMHHRILKQIKQKDYDFSNIRFRPIQDISTSLILRLPSCFAITVTKSNTDITDI